MNPLILKILMSALMVAPKVAAEIEKGKADATQAGQDTATKLSAVLGDIATVVETLATAL